MPSRIPGPISKDPAAREVDGSRILAGTVPQTALDATTSAKIDVDSSNRGNALINGDFQIWQRGTTITSAGQFNNDDGDYCADRWMLISEGDDIFDVSRQTGTGGRYGLQLEVETANWKGGIFHILEGQASAVFANAGVASLSFSATASTTDISGLRYGILEWSGTEDAPTAGSPVAAWNIEDSEFVPITNWAHASTGSGSTAISGTSKVEYKLEGIAITAGTKNIGVFIISDDMSNTIGDTLLIEDVQLEANDLSSLFIRRPFGADLALSQRYFAKTFPYATVPADNAGRAGLIASNGESINGNLSLTWEHPVTMFKTPSTVQYNPDSTTAGRVERLSSTAPLAITDLYSLSSEDRTVRTLASGADSSSWGIHFTAEAELGV